MFELKPLAKENVPFIYKLMSEENNIFALHTSTVSQEEWNRTFVENENDTDEENFIIYSNNISCAWLKLNGLKNKDTAWISMLVVSDKFKRQGVGKFAIDFSIYYLKQRGFKQIKLHTTADNLAARKFYEKCGFSLFEECSSQLTMCIEV